YRLEQESELFVIIPRRDHGVNPPCRLIRLNDDLNSSVVQVHRVTLGNFDAGFLCCIPVAPRATVDLPTVRSKGSLQALLDIKRTGVRQIGVVFVLSRRTCVTRYIDSYIFPLDRLE